MKILNNCHSDLAKIVNITEQGLKCGKQLGEAVWLVHEGNQDLESSNRTGMEVGKGGGPGTRLGRGPPNSRSGEDSGPASAGSFVSFPPICFHKW